MFDPPALPPAGWYPDPERPRAQRYWNGLAWEEPYQTDALPDVGEMLNRAFAAMSSRWRAVAILAAITSAPAYVIVQLATRRAFNGLEVVHDDLRGWNSDRIPLLVVLAVIGLFLYSIAGLALNVLMLRTIDTDEQPRTTAREAEAALDALGAAVRTLPRAFGWGLVMGLAFAAVAALVVGAFVLAPALGVLLAIALIPLFVYALEVFAFISIAIVDAPGNPFTRSFAVVRGRFWKLFGRLFVIGLITQVLSGLLNIPVSIAGGGFRSTRFESTLNNDDTFNMDLSGLAPTTSSIVIGAVTTVVVTVLAASTFNAALAMLYRTRHPAQH